MNIGSGIIEKSFNDLIGSYKSGLDFLKIIEEKSNDSGNIQFIANNIQTIQSNEKLVTLYGAILKESLTMASVNLNLPLGTIEQSMEGDRSSPIDQPIADDHDMTVDTKFDVTPSGEHDNHADEFVDLTNKRVTFKETVTTLHYSSETDIEERRHQKEDKKSKNLTPTLTPTPKKKDSPKLTDFTPSPKKKESPKLKPKKNESKLAAHNAQQVRDGDIKFIKVGRSRCSLGMCFFCDELKTYNKAQWQHHLLAHTNEMFYHCGECGLHFDKRKGHKKCSSTAIQNIYQHNNCSGDDYLAAFMCKICNYVQVNEQKVVEHVLKKHAGVFESPRDSLNFYEKYKFVKNV